MKNNIKTKQIIIVLAILTLLTFGVYQISNREQNVSTENSIQYISHEEIEKELDNEEKKELEEYNKATKGTIVEQLKYVSVPSYDDENQLIPLQNGSVEARAPKSSEFTNGIFLWSASLEKGVSYFTIGDFNKDGLDDVAHVIGYTGGGSGYFYELTIFINENGKLRYLTQESLGDRVIIKSIKYNSGLFTVEMITQGEGDDFQGYAHPNVLKTVKFKLDNYKLLEI